MGISRRAALTKAMGMRPHLTHQHRISCRLAAGSRHGRQPYIVDVTSSDDLRAGLLCSAVWRVASSRGEQREVLPLLLQHVPTNESELRANGT